MSIETRAWKPPHPENNRSSPKVDQDVSAENAVTTLESTTTETVTTPEAWNDQLKVSGQKAYEKNPGMFAEQQALRDAQSEQIKRRELQTEAENAKNARSKAILDQANARREGEMIAKENIANFKGDAKALTEYKNTVLQVLEMTSKNLDQAEQILSQYKDIQTPEAKRIRSAQELARQDAERSASQYSAELKAITAQEKTQKKEIDLNIARNEIEKAFQQTSVTVHSSEKQAPTSEAETAFQQLLTRDKPEDLAA